MKSITEAGFPSLAFFEMVAQIKPSANHVLVSLGGEEGRLEWRPYGSGFVGTITFSTGLITVTSSILNGDVKSLYYFDDDHVGATNSVLPFDFYCTGQIWEFTTGGLNVTIFTGTSFPAVGFPNPPYVLTRYIASFNSATDDYDISWTESFITDETNQKTLEFNNTSGNGRLDTDYSSNTTIRIREFSAFNETKDNVMYFNINNEISIYGTQQYPSPTNTYFLGYQYAEINVTSAEILTLGTVGKELLPSPPSANQYYSIAEWAIEYTHVTTPYTTPVGQSVCIGNTQITSIDSSLLLGSGVDNVVTSKGLSGGQVDSNTLYMMLKPEALQSGVYLYTQDFADPTLGDGTIKVKLWYSIRTFG